MNLREFIQYWKDEIRIFIVLTNHPQLPKVSKILVIILLSYLFSPIDLIPDFIPIIGYIDDLIIVPLLGKLIYLLTPQELMSEVRNSVSEGQDMQFTGKSRILIGLVFLFAWMLLIWYVFTLMYAF